MKDLTQLEEIVMIAIWSLKDEANGVSIKKMVNEMSGKNYFYNVVYTTFEQLVRKGFVTKYYGEPTAVRGGKRKVFFKMTDTGLQALERAYERQNRIWSGITKDAIKGGFAS